jgi:hypothetical protein
MKLLNNLWTGFKNVFYAVTKAINETDPTYRRATYWQLRCYALTTALEFYANPDSWKPGTENVNAFVPSKADKDKGKLARETLEGVVK